MSEPRWLVLAHQLPARPSNARVKTWRRLQQVGAVHARNSVYVLPNTEQNREAFEWIRKEIIALNGEATVFAADALNDADAELIAAFRRAREADYRALKRDADALARTMRPSRGASASRPYAKTARALRDRLTTLQRIDFFGAAGGPLVVETLDAIDAVASGRPAAPAGARPRVAAANFQNRRWVTRPRPGVDRMASAWLIRRFIDAKAEFAFAKQPPDGAVAFDMYVGTFTHDGPLCTFENIVRQFGIRDTAVNRIAQIVHYLDIKDTGLPPPEAAAIDRMIEGLQDVHTDDHALLEQGIAMFEAFARSFAASERLQPRSRKNAPKPKRRTSR
jgi:Uncharacterized conserved protein